MQRQEGNEEEDWIQRVERIEERRRQRFSSEIRRIRENDPTLTSIHENFKCEVSGGVVIPAMLSAMLTNTNLLNLSIASCDFHEGVGGGSFGRMLLTNSSLQHLVLRDCHVSAMGAATLLRSLAANTTLVTLDLSDNSQIFETERASVMLRNCLPQMKGLKTLNLSNTHISKDAVRALFYGLERNTTLQSLNLSDNEEIGDVLADSLIESLPRMKGLEILNVQHAKLSAALDQQPEKMEVFAKAMRTNTRIWKIDDIVLHQVDHYKSVGKDEMEKQRICHQYLREIECCKQRNGFLTSGWLKVNQRSIWPKVLERIGEQKGHDMVFFLLQEKSDLFFGSCYKSPEPLPFTQHKQQDRDKNHDTCFNHPCTIDMISKHQHAQTSRIRRRRRSYSPCISPGFHCKIHGHSRFVPSECCAFETMLPEIKKIA